MPANPCHSCKEPTMKRDDRKPERYAFLVFAAAYGAMLAKSLLGPLIQ